MDKQKININRQNDYDYFHKPALNKEFFGVVATKL